MQQESYKKSKVFISYAREDLGAALKLWEQLKKTNCDPWIDKKNLLPGEKWPIAIRRAIKNSDFFLACLSKKSVSKIGFFQTELKEGYEILKQYPSKNIYIIPARLEDCDVPEELQDYNWVNLFEPQGFSEVLKAIQEEWPRRGIKWPEPETSEVHEELDPITKTVKRAVETVCSRRCSSNGFVDDYVEEKAFVSTCEGLECILVPCLNFERITLSGLLKEFPNLLLCLQEDVSYLISRSGIAKDKGKVSFPGDPYLGPSKFITPENQLPNLDSTAFTVATMLHLKAFIEKGELSQRTFPTESMESLVRAGLTQIRDSHIENQGWPWGVGIEESHIYFTWSVLETLVDAFEYDSDRKLFDDYDSLIAAMVETRQWIEQELLPDMTEGKELGLGKKDITQTYFYIESLIILTLLETSKYSEIADFLKHLLPFCGKIAKRTVFAEYPIRNQPTTLTDYSIILLLLRAVSAAFLEFRDEKVFKEEVGGTINYEKIIQQRVTHLDQKKIKDGLWAYNAKKFEWYYTERAIEALTMYYLYRQGRKKGKLPTKSLRKLREDLRKTLKEDK